MLCLCEICQWPKDNANGLLSTFKADGKAVKGQGTLLKDFINNLLEHIQAFNGPQAIELPGSDVSS